MFSVRERDLVRERLLRSAREDPAVLGAAITGSLATGDADRWSDIDLALAVSDPLDAVMWRWTRRMYAEFGAAHHWDLPSGPLIYRVFLLPDCLEVDIAFGPAAEFGPRGPSWRLVFGQPAPPPIAAPAGPDQAAGPDQPAGLAWHHALHARASIERGRWWQAEHWIGALRTETLALACLRLGFPTAYAKGAHRLPADLTGPLEATLVRSLDESELRRALRAAAAALGAELARTDAALAGRLHPTLTELAAAG